MPYPCPVDVSQRLKRGTSLDDFSLTRQSRSTIQMHVQMKTWMKTRVGQWERKGKGYLEPGGNTRLVEKDTRV